MNAKELYGIADNIFSKRSTLTLLWQELAEHFYPERADFTLERTLGTDFAGNMMTSYPMLVRRDLSDQIGQMLRPSNKEYARIGLRGHKDVSNEVQRYLEWFQRTMRRAMYDRRSLFTDASKMADNDFATFGMDAMQIRMAKSQDALLFRSWHLRDMAWQEDGDGKIVAVFRRHKAQARDMKRAFGVVHRDVEKCLTGTPPRPFEEFDCMHMCVEMDMYDGKAPKGMNWWSIWYDCAHDHLLEAVAVPDCEYVISRWLKPGSSPYAFSPAAIVALPEARLLQAMTYTIVEAGEKLVNPPMVAVVDAVRSDVNTFAGGVTWASQEYDERTGEVLRPMKLDVGGMPIGMDMIRDARSLLMQAFFLNKLTLPQRGPEMTAYEVGQRVQEYIRGALPLFEPMEMERNGQEWELTFHLMRRRGAFGSELDWPKELRAEDIEFTFESPIHDAVDAVKGHTFLESQQYIAAAVQLDPSAAMIMDSKTALREVLAGIKAPATWVNSEIKVRDMEAQAQAQVAAQQQLAAMQQGSEVVANLAGASRDSAQAGAPV